MFNQYRSAGGADKRSRRPLTVASFLLALAALAYTGNWFASALWLKGRIEAWAEARRAAGDEVGYAALAIEGFPFEIGVVAEDLTLARRDGAGERSIAAERLRVLARPWAPLTFALIGESPLLLNHSDPKAGRRWTATLAGARIDGRLYPSGALAEADLTVVGGAIDARRAEAPETEPFRLAGFGVSEISLDLAEPAERVDHKTATAVLGGRIRAVDLPLGAAAGPGTADVAFEATLKGALSGIAPEDLALWRSDGGTLEIDHLRVDRPPLSGTMQATLALDRLLRPEGAGTVEVRGLDPLIDRLVAEGRIKREAATASKLMLLAFTKPGSDGGAPVVRLPVSAQDGEVRAGPLALFRFAPP